MICIMSLKAIRGLDRLGTFSEAAMVYKGGNFYDFLFTFQSTKPLLKRGLLKGKNIFLLREDSFKKEMCLL